MGLVRQNKSHVVTERTEQLCHIKKKKKNHNPSMKSQNIIFHSSLELCGKIFIFLLNKCKSSVIIATTGLKSQVK